MKKLLCCYGLVLIVLLLSTSSFPLSYETDVGQDGSFETSLQLTIKTSEDIDIYVDGYSCPPNDKLFGVMTYITLDETCVSLSNCTPYDTTRGGPFDPALCYCQNPVPDVYKLDVNNFNFLTVTGNKQKLGTIKLTTADDQNCDFDLVIADDQTAYGYPSFTDGTLFNCNLAQQHPSDAVLAIDVVQEVCYADSDGNQKVDLSDLVLLKSEFLKNTCAPSSNTCSGTLSPLGRWCDQNNGTVKDMTTGLVWLKNAGWGGHKKWEDCTTHDDANTRAGLLNQSSGAGLSDGSHTGDWRLPTLKELFGITVGDEYIRSSQMFLFTNVVNSVYWSSTTLDLNTAYAEIVNMTDGSKTFAGKASANLSVWPVRGPL